MKPAAPVLAIILVAVAAVVAYSSLSYRPPAVLPADTEVVPFHSESEFRAYIESSRASSAGSYYGGFGALGISRSFTEALDGIAAPMASDAEKSGGAGEGASRVSETNVQVAGIDEPDILKTDGRNIYFSPEGGYGYYRYWGYSNVGTRIIKAFPPADMAAVSNVTMGGNLLLHDGKLVVFGYDTLTGYDVSDPADPAESWRMELNGSVVAARLYGGKIYLVTSQYINEYRPCPIVPLTKDGSAPVVISCTRIYHPPEPTDADVTYNVMVIDPADGSTENAVSFLGSSSYSTVYMSGNAIYITNQYQGDYFEILAGFLYERCADLLPAEVFQKIDRLKGYDISAQSKLTELQMILSKYQSSLDEDESLRVQTEMSNRMVNYTADHKRDFTRTGITKVGLDMEVKASGSVPGVPLNQFSLDESGGNLRVAVTVGGWGWWSSGETAADVYVLDASLDAIGSVLDLGKTERIYSVRFIGDKAYVVTFRQTDPFYVLDMSDPANPVVKGELKIPGFSSYLHPIDDSTILGVGREGSQVKLSLFDVSDPESPVEKDKYMLNEYWTDVTSTHHAFLMDAAHEVFFLPAGSSGYVLSYAGGSLELKKAVADISATRALYLDDYLYIAGDYKIVVLDEATWEKVKELELQKPPPVYRGIDDVPIE